jgi:hypothetical protein
MAKQGGDVLRIKQVPRQQAQLQLTINIEK